MHINFEALSVLRLGVAKGKPDSEHKLFTKSRFCLH